LKLNSTSFPVLLQAFGASQIKEKAAAELEVEKENAKRRITGSLDGITKSLTAFQSPENLREKMDDLYQQLDRDGSGGLNFEEVSLSPPHLSPPPFPPLSQTFINFIIES